MPEDIVHIQRHMQNIQAEITDYERRADIADRQAQDHHSRGEDSRAVYFEQEHREYKAKAEDLKKQNEQYEADMKQQQQKLPELQQKREKLVNDFNSQLATLDREIGQVSGTSLSL